MDLVQLEILLKTVAFYGAAFVFTVLFLLIILYAAWKLTLNVVGLIEALREWVPLWFQSQIKTGERVATSVDTLTETLGATSSKTHAGVRGLVTAAYCHVTGDCKEQFTDAVRDHLKDAKDALE